jgi:hypothetical protein
MSLSQIIITMFVGGAVIWLVHKYLPIPGIIKTIFNIVVVSIVWFLAFEVFVSCYINEPI